ncbi:MAG: hypothetical protein WDA75_01735, partial [Candidatus Latescibacterota bacterium]
MKRVMAASRTSVDLRGAREWLVLLLPALVWLAMSACGRPAAVAPEDRETGELALVLALPKALAGQVAWVEYQVTDGVGDTLRGNLVIGADQIARGTIVGVPAQVPVVVRLTAYDGQGTARYSGAATAEVGPGETARLRLVLRPVADTTGTGGTGTEPDTTGTGGTGIEPDTTGTGGTGTEPDTTGTGGIGTEPDTTGTGGTGTEPDTTGAGGTGTE